MERTLVSQTPTKIGKRIKLYGWVNSRRDHGKIVFLDLRDSTGIVQLVLDSSKAQGIKPEFVLETVGLAKKRPPHLVNPKLETGQIEIETEEITVLNKSETLPFGISANGLEVDEEIRLKYRYLDLRRKRMTDNIRIRHRFIKFIRNWLDEKGFVEIETPVLTKATPEGARDFIVPSRLQKGNFYALPQSPQQYKQLLMVAGFERYYQIARCFRDEDPRIDRAYGEFTQLDLEMSFPTQEEILNLVEDLFTNLAKTLFPQKHITLAPFPRLSYHDAMEKYGSDKPDLRKNKNDPNELAFCWVLDFPLFEWKETENRWDSMHHPFTAPRKEDVSLLDQKDKIKDIRSYQHDLVLNGYEIAGGSIRITDPDLQSKIFEILGHTPEKIQQKFGHLLTAFKFGVPPHGGIAPGLDRILMILQNEPTLREVIAFPTSSTGKTAVMEAPSEVDEEQLKELAIEIVKTRKTKLKSLFEKLTDLLDKNKIEYEPYEHKPVFTSKDAARTRSTKIEQGAKALVMIADKKPVLIVTSANKKVDSKKFKKIFQVKDLKMCTAEEVRKITGVGIGAVPPFGNLMGLKTFVDKGLAQNLEIAFNAGLNTKSVKMKYQDFFSLVKPEVNEFGK